MNIERDYLMEKIPQQKHSINVGTTTLNKLSAANMFPIFVASSKSAL